MKSDWSLRSGGVKCVLEHLVGREESRIIDTGAFHLASLCRICFLQCFPPIPLSKFLAANLPIKQLVGKNNSVSNANSFPNISRRFLFPQAVIRPTKVVEQLVDKVKSNPLKNRAAMVKLNPFHDAVRKREQEKKAAALKQRGEKLAKKRAGVQVRQGTQAISHSSVRGGKAFLCRPLGLGRVFTRCSSCR